MLAARTENDTQRTHCPAVLVVDDHRANILALEAVLAPLPYRVVSAASGAEALRLVHEEEFALALMDVHMPGLDGFQTVELLRGTPRGRDLPVFFVTAVHQMSEFVRRGYALGAIDYISKPYDPDVLRAKVSAFVSMYVRGRGEERRHRDESDRLKDLFLGAVGHDLRSPLNAIVVTAGVLRSGSGASEAHVRSAAQRIDRNARRMNEILDDLLHLVRGRFAGGMPLDIRPTDLEAVCRGVITELQAQHADRVIEMVVVGDAHGQWDAARLARVVQNLLGNALKHANEGRVRLEIAGTAQETVTVSVHNGGPAIPADVLPRLFEPFRRGPTTAEGMGLGLYIVREIASAHGGAVHVTSTEREGTRFSLTLPRAPLVHASADAANDDATRLL